MRSQEMYCLMGKMVVVSKEFERPDYDKEGYRTIPIKDVEPRTGWVVGFTVKHEGQYNSGSWSASYYGEEDYWPPSLTIKKVIPCMLVRYWPNRKEVCVPLDGYRLAIVGKDLPYCEKKEVTV